MSRHGAAVVFGALDCASPALSLRIVGGECGNLSAIDEHILCIVSGGVFIYVYTECVSLLFAHVLSSNEISYSASSLGFQQQRCLQGLGWALGRLLYEYSALLLQKLPEDRPLT